MKQFVKYIASILLFACAGMAHAQHTIIVDPEVSCLGSSQYADLLRGKVMNAFGDVGFIRLLDGNAATGEEAEFSLSLQVGEYVELPIYDKDDKSNILNYKYKYKIPFTLKIIRLSDKTVYASKSFASDGYGKHSRDEAIEASINRSMHKVLLFVNEKLPIEGELLEITLADGEKAQELYISLGSDIGIQKGQSLWVKGITVIAGKPVPRTLGKIKVTEVEGEDASRCKVIDGHEKIMKFYNEQPDKIVVQTEKGWGPKNWLKTL